MRSISNNHTLNFIFWISCVGLVVFTIYDASRTFEFIQAVNHSQASPKDEGAGAAVRSAKDKNLEDYDAITQRSLFSPERHPHIGGTLATGSSALLQQSSRSLAEDWV